MIQKKSLLPLRTFAALREIKFLSLFIILLACLQVNAQNVLPKPNPPRLVVDEAGLLSKDQQQILEQKLDAFNDSTSNQIAVVTINSLNEVPIEDYAVKLLREWGIGGSKHNNGVLLLISKNDKKFRIEVGYGLEGAITDILSSDILENNLEPNFKNEDYYRGIDEATTSLEKAAVDEYKEQGTRKENEKSGGGNILGFIIIVIIIIFVSSRGRGGRGGGMMSRRGFNPWIIPTIFSGGWGDGRGGFGGGGGGGFGGFGGGSSGGGGASGGW